MGMSDFWIGAFEQAFDDFTGHQDVSILRSDLKALGLDEHEIQDHVDAACDEQEQDNER